LYLALAPTHHLMRILRPIVFSQTLLMVAGKSEIEQTIILNPAVDAGHGGNLRPGLQP